MSPKEKVRANIYKALLEEEKRKNRGCLYSQLAYFLLEW